MLQEKHEEWTLEMKSWKDKVNVIEKDLKSQVDATKTMATGSKAVESKALTRLGEIEKEYEKLQALVAEVEDRTKRQLGAAIDGVEHKIEGVQGEIENKVSQSTHDEDIQGLDYKITAQASRMTNLEGNLGSLGESINSWTIEKVGLKDGATPKPVGGSCLTPLEYGLGEVWRVILKLHKGAVEMRKAKEVEAESFKELLYQKADNASFDPIQRQISYMKETVAASEKVIAEEVSGLRLMRDGAVSHEDIEEKLKELEQNVTKQMIHTDLASLSRLKDIEAKISSLATAVTAGVGHAASEQDQGATEQLAALSGRCLSCNNMTGIPTRRPSPPPDTRSAAISGSNGQLYKGRGNMTPETLAKVAVRQRPQTARDRKVAGYGGRQANSQQSHPNDNFSNDFSSRETSPKSTPRERTTPRQHSPRITPRNDPPENNGLITISATGEQTLQKKNNVPLKVSSVAGSRRKSLLPNDNDFKADKASSFPPIVPRLHNMPVLGSEPETKKAKPPKQPSVPTRAPINYVSPGPWEGSPALTPSNAPNGAPPPLPQ